MAQTSISIIFFVLLFSYFIILCEAGILHLSLKEDPRPLIIIGSFGFTHSGRLEIEVSDVSISQASQASNNDPSLMGFFLVTEDDWIQVLSELDQQSLTCLLQSHSIKLLFDFSKLHAATHYNNTFPAPGANRYTLMFANCQPQTMVSLNLRTSMYNFEGKSGIKDYLSEGQTQLPSVYFSFFLLYLVGAGVWTYVCLKQKQSVHHIHIFMGVLVVLKALYMFSEAEDKSYIKKTGTPHGWDIAFYSFNFLRGIMLFTIIVLIGTGWSFLKPFLQGREKKVLMIVIPLQVIENIVTFVLGETGPFLKDFFTWTQLLLLIDIICCCAVLFPIVWSIKHLREAARTDGKAARNLVKLTLFRQYYIVVVSYIYFTRIVVFALRTVTSYHYTWVSELAGELASVSFYIFTGYKFRPVQHNPYFVLDDEEEELAAEEALKDDDFEL